MSGFMHQVSQKIKRKSTSRDASPAPQSPHRGSNDDPANGVVSHSSTFEKISSGESSDHTSAHRGSRIKTELLSKIHHASPDRSHPEPKTEGDELSKNQIRKREKRKEDEEKKERQHRDSEDLQRRRVEEEERAEQEDSPEMRARYGTLPINNYANEYKPSGFVNLLNLTTDDIGKEITFRGRIHNTRRISAKLGFFVLRQQTATIQGILFESEKVSKYMMHWAEHLPVESLVVIKGIVQAPKAKEGEIIGTVIHDKEIQIEEIHLVAKLTEHLPFTVNEAEVTEAEANAEGSNRHHVPDRTRLAARILDLRTTTSQAIFRVQSGVSQLFRSFLDSQGFIEIHSPKLQGGATESGASVFKVDYFGRVAFLAQSPQLAKQMSIAADFGRVFEVGAVFRAENSNTHRHLTEYTGLDIEMAIEQHYWEVRTMVDRTLKNIFEGLYKRFKPEIEIIKRQYPHEDLVWLDETPIINFKDAIKMLNDSGWRDEKGNLLADDEDFDTRSEIQFGKIMKEKYKTDYYIVDKFPASARPFYTMPDPVDPTYTNSFDIFVRGQEITTGGERVHDAAMLIAQMKKAKVDPKTMEEYMQGFEWGAPPHAGAGIGLERIMMLMLQLNDIRHASMYPRDPRSLPAIPVIKQLPHPEADTLALEVKPSSEKKELPPIEKLIPNYGDASNTSWLEPRTHIWRDADTGAAIGYVPHQGFCITLGDPLCHESQYFKIISTFLDYVHKETELKPLWLLCGTPVEEVLAEKFNYRTFSVVNEQRLDLRHPLKVTTDRDLQRKIRHADKEGVKIHDISLGTPVPKEVVAKCDQRIQDWLGARKEHQHVHLTDVHPWQDMAHRQYHYATDKNNTIAALVVMAQLSPQHGWQVKYALDFPGAPSGCIESVVTHALQAVKNTGAISVTFGGGASSKFTPGHNLKGTKVKMLARAYHTIATELKLNQKSEFREKLGTEDDPIFVCYPPKGLGPKGVHAILSFFED